MSERAGRKVIVGLSGGVDSAVAALLLLEQGWDVQGLFMSNWDEEDTYCTAAQDFQDARMIARELRIPLHRVSFASEYRERVFEHFLQEHRSGRTPNPDVLCNREIKFSVAIDYAQRLGSDCFATGHYAQVCDGPEGRELHKACDLNKDQSYFLHAVERRYLSRTVMPLGTLEKGDVREKARRAGLPVFDKPDSTGICFIGERPFRDFLARYLPRTPGVAKTPEGKVVGEHQGVAYYTIGQRNGLKIGGQAGGDGSPWFVAAKNPQTNELTVVQGHDHPLLLRDSVEISGTHWISGLDPHTHWVYAAKTRYRQEDAPCSLGWIRGRGALVEFAEPQWAVTPGQYAVVYESKVCLGGGVIE